MSGQQLASHWARSPPGGVAGIDGIPADRVCPSQRRLTCRFIIHWTPTSHLISMIVDTCDSADRHSAAFRAVSVWHVQSDRPPSLGIVAVMESVRMVGSSCLSLNQGVCLRPITRSLKLVSQTTCETIVRFCGVSVWSMAFVCAGWLSAVVRMQWLHMAEWLRFLFHRCPCSSEPLSEDSHVFPNMCKFSTLIW